MTIEEARDQIQAVVHEALNRWGMFPEVLELNVPSTEAWQVKFRPVEGDGLDVHERYIKPAGYTLADRLREGGVGRCSGVLCAAREEDPTFDGDPSWSFMIRGAK